MLAGDPKSEENNFLMKFFEEKIEKQRYCAKTRKYRRELMDKLVQIEDVNNSNYTK